MTKLKHGAIALVCIIGCATACAQTRTLTVIAGGGLQGEGVFKAFVEPFEKETGIKVYVVRDQAMAAQIKLKAKSGKVDVDLAVLTAASSSALFHENLLEPIDYRQIEQGLMAKFDAESRKPWGVQVFYSSWVLGLDASKYPAGKPMPSSWADFWDVSRFPGTRVMQNGELGSQGPFEEALLADGVPVDKLYPLDIDRAFRSLDKIKPHIRKWWKLGSEQMQLFSSGGTAMGMGFDGRFTALTQAGKPMTIVWHQAKMGGVYWVIPKGAKNVKEAHQFIEFASRAQPQAAFVRMTGYAPANPEAFAFIDKELAKVLVSYPDNRKQGYAVNGDWYAQVGADGKTNSERLAQRWNEWITK
ncbi:ABC transporter substrate-binding protein [Variovorax sp. KK3]|uniref:ABC transporter substrate-binding protein n=1 Tax=Variovorax sp. KK3 TaxID=1855728 RepID=UPI00097C3F2D|nr:ABC transporter substrate-binding protein [Variovorax sp. KK3]